MLIFRFFFSQVVGTIAFIVLQGRKYGPQAHNRYFQLKGMSKTQREQHIEERQGAYSRYDMTDIRPRTSICMLIMPTQLRRCRYLARDSPNSGHSLRIHEHDWGGALGGRHRAEGRNGTAVTRAGSESRVNGVLNAVRVCCRH